MTASCTESRSRRPRRLPKRQLRPQSQLRHLLRRPHHNRFDSASQLTSYPGGGLMPSPAPDCLSGFEIGQASGLLRAGTRSRRISGLTVCYAQAGQVELARIQGREILRVSPKFDMALYAKSLTYQDPEDSRRSLDALAKAFAPAANPSCRRCRCPRPDYLLVSSLLSSCSTLAAMSGMSRTR